MLGETRSRIRIPFFFSDFSGVKLWVYSALLVPTRFEVSKFAFSQVAKDSITWLFGTALGLSWGFWASPSSVPNPASGGFQEGGGERGRVMGLSSREGGADAFLVTGSMNGKVRCGRVCLRGR